jgi:hypothetical protein
LRTTTAEFSLVCRFLFLPGDHKTQYLNSLNGSDEVHNTELLGFGYSKNPVNEARDLLSFF